MDHAYNLKEQSNLIGCSFSIDYLYYLLLWCSAINLNSGISFSKISLCFRTSFFRKLQYQVRHFF